MTVSSMGLAYVLNVGIVSHLICIKVYHNDVVARKYASIFAIIFPSREAVCATRGHSPENGKGQVGEL